MSTAAKSSDPVIKRPKGFQKKTSSSIESSNITSVKVANKKSALKNGTATLPPVPTYLAKKPCRAIGSTTLKALSRSAGMYRVKLNVMTCVKDKITRDTDKIILAASAKADAGKRKTVTVADVVYAINSTLGFTILSPNSARRRPKPVKKRKDVTNASMDNNEHELTTQDATSEASLVV